MSMELAKRAWRNIRNSKDNNKENNKVNKKEQEEKVTDNQIDIDDPIVLSIIVPIYNVEAYLKDCLDSIEKLVSSISAEVIMIDDGSTDRSADIAKEFQKKSEKYTFYEQRHKGVGAARNYGVNMSKGEYILFVDSDDQIIPEVYLEMIGMLENKDADFAVCRAARLDRERVKPALLMQRCFYNLKGSHATIYEHPGFVFDASSWNKVIRKSFYIKSEIQYPEGYYYEDGPAMLELHCKAKDVAICWKVGYLWRIRNTQGESITQNDTDYKHLMDKIAMLERCLDLIKNNYYDEKVWHALQWKVFRTDLNLFLFGLKKLERTRAQKHLEEIASFVEKCADMAVVATFPVIYEQVFKDILKRDLDHLIRVLNYWITSHPNAPYIYHEDGRVTVTLPDVLFEHKECFALHEADYIAPECLIRYMNIDEKNVIHIHGSLYLRKVQTNDKYPQHLSARLIDDDNHEYPLSIDVEAPPKSVIQRGEVISHVDYSTYYYDYSLGGFHLSINLPSIDQDDSINGDNTVFISHENHLSKGVQILDNIPMGTRNYFANYKYDGKYSTIKLSFDELGTLTITKQSKDI